ncbi:hypothetical protein LIER_25561 [Lithospermum erythrorhizon]|uniref:Reverse transcriptase Ty1/copia-type domain-containing protein n=1 Tax=Lithospermum erythrorhizon TaxID=34254 RepID=A0AAV3R8L1_LITER
MDVDNAFLHGDLPEKIYIRLPPGFNKGRPGLVCKLHKSLYRLKQAPSCWFSKLATIVKRFAQSRSGYCKTTQINNIGKKRIANKFKPVMKKLVADNQCSFIPG